MTAQVFACDFCGKEFWAPPASSDYSAPSQGQLDEVAVVQAMRCCDPRALKERLAGHESAVETMRAEVARLTADVRDLRAMLLEREYAAAYGHEETPTKYCPDCDAEPDKAGGSHAVGCAYVDLLARTAPPAALEGEK
jgi:hypothetical protein